MVLSTREVFAFSCAGYGIKETWRMMRAPNSDRQDSQDSSSLIPGHLNWGRRRTRSSIKCPSSSLFYLTPDSSGSQSSSLFCSPLPVFCVNRHVQALPNSTADVHSNSCFNRVVCEFGRTLWSVIWKWLHGRVLALHLVDDENLGWALGSCICADLKTTED